MIGYASRTGTRRNLRALGIAGWRILVSARGALRPEGLPYALDNGAWTAHQRQEPFDSTAFVRAVESLGHGADFVVAPDVVGNARASWSLTRQWLPWVLDRVPGLVLIAVQDGMSAQCVGDLIGGRVGLAIGGSTAWKENALARREFSDLGCYVHALRVNTVRRVNLCLHAGCDSIDGSSVSRFSSNLPRLDAALRQGDLWDRS